MVQFKLRLGSRTCDIAFENVEQPSWHEISREIDELYGIPYSSVALVYLVVVGRKMMVSSQAELNDYYLAHTCFNPKGSHRFVARTLIDGIDPTVTDWKEDSFLGRDAFLERERRVLRGTGAVRGNLDQTSPPHYLQLESDSEDFWSDEVEYGLSELNHPELDRSEDSVFDETLYSRAGSATQPESYVEHEIPDLLMAEPHKQHSTQPPAKTRSRWRLPLPSFRLRKSSNTSNQVHSQQLEAVSPASSKPEPKFDPRLSDDIRTNPAEAPTQSNRPATTTSAKPPTTPWGTLPSASTATDWALGTGSAPNLLGLISPPIIISMSGKDKKKTTEREAERQQNEKARRVKQYRLEVAEAANPDRNHKPSPAGRSDPALQKFEDQLATEPDFNTTRRAGDTISRRMSISSILDILVQHGCKNVTRELQLSSCSEYPIACGGLGDIYRGQLIDGAQVAIKCMRITAGPIQNKEQKYLINAARELHTWSKLDHRYILKLVGLAQYRDQIAIVSPWVKNGPLPQYLESHPQLNRPKMCMKIADGLEFLHAEKIVHGDLKGANVLVSKGEDPLLMDFGNATVHERTLRFTRAQTKGQISLRWTVSGEQIEAPEQLLGEAESSKETDVYALGMTILETITGDYPYPGKNENSVFAALMNKQTPDRPEQYIPATSADGETLWSLLQHCWDSEPTNRPTARRMARITPKGLVVNG